MRARPWRRIDTVGYVEYDRTRLRHIDAPAEGNVDTLAISSEGERVSKGQFLFEVFSPMLSGSEDETYADWGGVVVELNMIASTQCLIDSESSLKASLMRLGSRI